LSQTPAIQSVGASVKWSRHTGRLAPHVAQNPSANSVPPQEGHVVASGPSPAAGSRSAGNVLLDDVGVTTAAAAAASSVAPQDSQNVSPATTAAPQAGQTSAPTAAPISAPDESPLGAPDVVPSVVSVT